MTVLQRLSCSLGTLDELKTLARHHPLFEAKGNIEEEVAHKFHPYGGKARPFFFWHRREEDLERDLDEAIRKLLEDAKTTAAYICASKLRSH